MQKARLGNSIFDKVFLAVFLKISPDIFVFCKIAAMIQCCIQSYAVRSCSIKPSFGHILVLRGRAPFGRHQKSRPQAGPDFLSMRFEFVLYPQPIRFVRLDSEHAQSDRKSVIHGLPVLDVFPCADQNEGASGDENATIHTNPLTPKRSFSKALFKPEEFKEAT